MSTLTDTARNSYIKAVGPVTGAGTMSGWRQELWYAKNIVGGSNLVVTATFTGSFNGEKAITAHEYAGLDPSAPLDVTMSSAVYAANAASNAVTTNYATELIVGVGLFQSSGNAGSSFTRRSSIASNVSEDRVVFAPGSNTVTFTNTSQNVLVLGAAFRAAGQ